MSDAPKMFPNQYAGSVLSGTDTGEEVAFGFNATYLRIANRGPGSIYFDLGSTGAATTDDAALSSGETFDAAVPPCAGVGFASASTGEVDVMALG